MKVIRFKWNLSIGYPGAEREGESYVEVEDNASDEEIEDAIYEAAQEDSNNYIELYAEQIN